MKINTVFAVLLVSVFALAAIPVTQVQERTPKRIIVHREVKKQSPKPATKEIAQEMHCLCAFGWCICYESGGGEGGGYGGGGGSAW